MSGPAFAMHRALAYCLIGLLCLSTTAAAGQVEVYVKASVLDDDESCPLPTSSNSGNAVFVGNSCSSVSVTFVSKTAGYTNILSLDSPSSQSIFDCAPGAGSVSLGAFPGGSELVFKIVNQDGTFYTGSGSRNPDLFVHASVTDQGGSGGSRTLRVGFEDLLNLGDADFDDCVFDVTGPVYTT